MRIEDERDDGKQSISTVRMGEVFERKEEFFIKTDKIEGETDQNHRAVNLATGKQVSFWPGYMVKKVECSLMLT